MINFVGLFFIGNQFLHQKRELKHICLTQQKEIVN